LTPLIPKSKCGKEFVDVIVITEKTMASIDNFPNVLKGT